MKEFVLWHRKLHYDSGYLSKSNPKTDTWNTVRQNNRSISNLCTSKLMKSYSKLKLESCDKNNENMIILKPLILLVLVLLLLLMMVMMITKIIILMMMIINSTRFIEFQIIEICIFVGIPHFTGQHHRPTSWNLNLTSMVDSLMTTMSWYPAGDRQSYEPLPGKHVIVKPNHCLVSTSLWSRVFCNLV